MTLLAALIVLAYGSVALVWPQRIQKWWSGNRLRRSVAMKVYGKFVESPTYVLHLRVMGAVAVVVGALLFASAFKMAESFMK
jgi:hypothetical protein